MYLEETWCVRSPFHGPLDVRGTGAKGGISGVKGRCSVQICKWHCVIHNLLGFAFECNVLSTGLWGVTLPSPPLRLTLLYYSNIL